MEELENCIWKFIYEMYGEEITKEFPEFEKCADCDGKKKCYIPLKNHLENYFQTYRIKRFYKNGETL